MDVTYPCVKCSKSCSETKCVLCYICDRWIYTECVPMSDSNLKIWDKHLMNFYCSQCCFAGGEFDSVKSLSSGKTVLGVDKTFNLCEMHVTVTCYKQLSVTRTSTSDNPLFIGPIFIHDNSDLDTYAQFFFNLKLKLHGVDTSQLVIGTDDERALVNAIKTVFQDSHHIRHLRQNVNQKLVDDTVDKYDKKTILDKIFGEDGLMHADDSICFEEISCKYCTFH